MAPSVEEAVKLQKPLIEAAQGVDRIYLYYNFCWELMKHPNVARFDKQKVVQAVLDYSTQGLKLARDPEFQKQVPEAQVRFLNMNWPNFYLTEAAAYLEAGDTPKVATALAEFRKASNVRGDIYAYIQAGLDDAMGRGKEALEGYLTAAADNYGDALTKAKAVYQKLFGTLDGFEAKLEAKQRQLPFVPQPFKAPAKWTGRTVLAELFTGSECPPCLATDLAFDGLIEAFGAKYLAVLEYHVPIPRPDPLMSPASRKRLHEYGLNSTPTPLFDGVKNESGGGNKSMAGEKFTEYSGIVAADLAEPPGVRLTVKASLQGDLVAVSFSADKTVADAHYDLVLVQKEETYRGANGVIFHKMVVKDLAVMTDEALKAGKFVFSLAAVESATAQMLADFEKQNSYTFPVKKYAIDRTRLEVVFFVQDKASNKVLNAAVAEVK
jgi:thiol-disulfide isomerase/thioredoxin